MFELFRYFPSLCVMPETKIEQEKCNAYTKRLKKCSEIYVVNRKKYLGIFSSLPGDV